MRTGKSTSLNVAEECVTRGRHPGAIQQVTLRHLDRLGLKPVAPLAPDEIKRIRERARVSQAVFAVLLNTSLSTIQKWEIGAKRPTGAALKLLQLVQRRGLDAVT